MEQCKDRCLTNTNNITSTLESLGFVINRNKSILIPNQKLIFFGFIIDTVEFKVFLTEAKINKIMVLAHTLLKNFKCITVRTLASFIGLIVNAFYAVFEAPLHYRAMERNKLVGLGLTMNFDAKVQLSQDCMVELNWWLNNVKIKNGKKIRADKVGKRCRTDSSGFGWGGIDLENDVCVQGRWSVVEQAQNINFLELLAIFMSIQALYKECFLVHIEIQTDNVCAMTYVNDMGGMSSVKMDKLAKDIWQFCLNRQITLSALVILQIFIAGIFQMALSGC